MAAFGLLALGVLIRAGLRLWSHLKGLNKALAGATENLNKALEEMRADLDETNENLTELRRRQETDVT
jgi:hypothetical protein